MTNLAEAELKQAAHALIGDDLASMTFDQLLRLITVAQYITDITLNEIEARGELTFHEELPIVPYISNYSVETVLDGDPVRWRPDGWTRRPRPVLRVIENTDNDGS